MLLGSPGARKVKKEICLSSNIIRRASGERVRNSRNNEYARREVVGFWLFGGLVFFF